MKPDWDKLMAAYNNSDTLLVADVDCTAAGKSKCEELGVRGYPTIKYGDPNNLKDYKQGRSYQDLEKFAATLAVPTCSPGKLELCDEETKGKITEFQGLSAKRREEMIKEGEGKIERIEAEFKLLVEGLNKAYQEQEAKQTQGIAAIKASGYTLLKGVHYFEARKETKAGTADAAAPEGEQ